jgi:hypothetical protein
MRPTLSLHAIRDSDGKIIPDREDLEAAERDNPEMSDADKWRTAQARRLLRWFEEQRQT